MAESAHSKAAKSSIFGDAKPVDTASREREIEKRLDKEMENVQKYYTGRKYFRSDSQTLKFITWNIDGLSEENLLSRTDAICCKIVEERTDIVFLQEVIGLSSVIILAIMENHNYHCVFGNSEGYFTAILLNKATVEFIDEEIINFPNTHQMRNALKVNVIFKSIPLLLINSHLESTNQCSEERKSQLVTIFDMMISAPENKTVIFGGDLNLRDREVLELGGLPEGIEDLWIVNGSRKDCKYTWDMSVNDNLSIPSNPKLRFDRVYVRHSLEPMLRSVSFNLIGQDRLPCGCFPSDHWGLLCCFKSCSNSKTFTTSHGMKNLL